MKKNWMNAFIGAAFLMATSAIGPGFLTQTAVFTGKLGASFAFVILMSVILDIGAQMNIWTVIAVSEKRAQDIANTIIPGLGYILSLLVVLGGLAFNIGNLAGAGLGMQVMFGIPVKMGAVISACIAIIIFLSRESGKIMDRVAGILGLIMIGLTFYVAFTSAPPMGYVLQGAMMPETFDPKAILTLVGGTVGGYITFAGGHRLLDAGIKGTPSIPKVKRSAITGIVLASIMRVVLFLAAFGVISNGMTLLEENPAASVFQLAAGNIGYKIFGIVMWSAAITSVIGAAYTSFSFISTFHPVIEMNRKWILLSFIVISAFVFIIIGQPVKTLVAVGLLNGFILPIALIVMLVAAIKLRKEGYSHPWWLFLFGAIVAVFTLYLSVLALQ